MDAYEFGGSVREEPYVRPAALRMRSVSAYGKANDQEGSPLSALGPRAFLTKRDSD
jgi:hypothetical protein